MHLVEILVALVCLATGAHGGVCVGKNDRDLLPCGGKPNADAASCDTDLVGRTCCYQEGLGCRVDGTQIQLGLPDLRAFTSGTFVPTVPSTNVARGFVQNIPSGNNPQVQRALGNVNPSYQANALSRSLTLGILLGKGGLGDLFPKCPVQVKLCYRVPCGGYSDTRNLDNNPAECLKDPTCCYDYELAFMKSLFGPTVMGGAPSCYYGPTSQQWRYITSFFKPWNAWFSNFIVEAFKEVFNTNLFNIGGQVLCQFDFQVKNYPVGSKSELECNLVSGCWDASRPVGKQCTLASSLIKNIFGGVLRDDNIYPSLYTDDFKDTQCVSNWFDFGARAYRRMECDVKDEPDELVKKITDWCPWQDCCLNYAAFSPTQLAQVSLISSIGGGGTPIGGGILPIAGGFPSLGAGGSIFGNQFGQGGGLTTPANANLLYLLTASSSGSLDLEKLFCPYRNLFPTFIDLTETTEGCCSIPKCYHKKKYLQPAQPTSPPTPPPFRFNGVWGNWGQCNALCGQQGSRTRSCFVNGVPTSQNSCPGAATEPCTGAPCEPTYTWGNWATSGCTVTCGGGTLTYTRPCLNNFQQSVDASLCPGGAGSGTSTSPCGQTPCPAPTPPPATYTWGNWATSGCTVTCGGGTLTYTRPCLNNFQQSVDASLCPGGAGSGTSTSPCGQTPCPVPTPPPASYSWGDWSVSQCSTTCGSGTLTYTRSCKNNFGQTVDPSFCPGGANSGTVTTTCNGNPCPTAPPPASYSWSQWQSSGCSVTCGNGTRTYTRVCQNNFGQTVDSSFCTGGAASGTTTTICTNPPCRANGQWGGWQDSTSCSATCGMNRIKRQTRTCTVNGVVQPNSACVGESTRVVQCPDVACPQQFYWTGYSFDTSCSYDQTTQRCSRTQTRYCYQKVALGWSLVQPQSQCSGQSQRVQDCEFVDCLGG